MQSLLLTSFPWALPQFRFWSSHLLKMLWCGAQIYSFSCRKHSELTALSPFWGLASLKEQPMSRSLHILKDSPPPMLCWCRLGEAGVGWGGEDSPFLPNGDNSPHSRATYESSWSPHWAWIIDQFLLCFSCFFLIPSTGVDLRALCRKHPAYECILGTKFATASVRYHGRTTFPNPRDGGGYIISSDQRPARSHMSYLEAKHLITRVKP